MKKISFNRRELYEKVWSIPIKELCDQIDVDSREMDGVCRRLNVPLPDKGYWKRLTDGKNVTRTPLPEKSKGVEIVTFFERNDDKLQQEQIQKIKSLFKGYGDQGVLKDYTFDKLVVSTKEGLSKSWEQEHTYWEKSKMLAIRVSVESVQRALLFMDLLIKVLKVKGHQLEVERHDMFAVINEERIQLSLKEKDKRVEYLDENNRLQKEMRPTGVFFLKKEGRSYESVGWTDGPKKGPIEDQVPTIVSDLEEMARQQKEAHERWLKSQEEKERQEKIRKAHEEKQSKELAKFRGLLLNAHRFQLAAQIREYIGTVERQATKMNELTDDLKAWILWARKRADWYDPSMPREEGDLLEGIDVENLDTRDCYYSSFGFSGHRETENQFWKPWWSK